MEMKVNVRKKYSTCVRSSNSDLVSSPGRKSKLRASLSESKQQKRKKIYSFDDLVEIMKPSVEELEYREKKSKDIDAVQKYSKLFKCTKCNMSFKSIIENHEKVPTHPCLEVLMCQNCCEYYLDGEFSVDSEGEEKYCRWCGEGGAILGCSYCICGFCTTCIKKHWKNDYLKKVQKDNNWQCFFCNPEPLWKHRFISSLAVKASNCEDTVKSLHVEKNIDTEKESADTFQNKASTSNENISLKPIKKCKEKSLRKRIYSSSSDESAEIQENSMKKSKFSRSFLESTCDEEKDDFSEHKKSDALVELGKILKLSENHMNFGMAWITKMFKKFTSPDYVLTYKNLVCDCQKIKQFLSLLSTYLVQFSNSVDSVERILQNDCGQSNSFSIQEKDPSPFSTILQFLEFVNNEVKIFVEKGFTLSDIFEMEVFDDGDIVGLRKKSNSTKPCSNQNGNNVTRKTTSDNEDIKSKENVEDEKRNRVEISPELITSQNTEMHITDGSDANSPENNLSNNSLEVVNSMKTTDSKAEIQEILAILENA